MSTDVAIVVYLCLFYGLPNIWFGGFGERVECVNLDGKTIVVSTLKGFQQLGSYTCDVNGYAIVLTRYLYIDLGSLLWLGRNLALRNIFRNRGGVF